MHPPLSLTGTAWLPGIVGLKVKKDTLGIGGTTNCHIREMVETNSVGGISNKQ